MANEPNRDNNFAKVKPYQVGEKIRHTLGGPEMTISRVGLGDNAGGMFAGDLKTVECEWFDEQEKLRRERFDPKMLFRVNRAAN